MTNWAQIGQSFDGLKNWVKIWILFLMLVNGASMFFLSTPIGQWTAFAAFFIVVSNSFLIIRYAGLTRVLAFPHLIWILLLVAITARLSTDGQHPQVSPVEFGFGIMVGITNAVSLLFDVNDSVQWMAGKREVLGLDS